MSANKIGAAMRVTHRMHSTKMLIDGSCPASNDLLRMWPVSKRVNVSSRGDDDPSLIEPVEDEAIADS
jgi:hypothetical protein